MEKEDAPPPEEELTPLKSVFAFLLFFLSISLAVPVEGNTLASILIHDLALLIIIAALLHFYGVTYGNLGFTRITPPGYLISFISAGVVIGINYLVTSFAETLPGYDAEKITQFYESVVQVKLDGKIMIGIVMLLVSPLLEEILFRGLIYRGFRRWGVPTASLLTSGLYAMFYMLINPWFALPVFIMGIILCILYERTGNLSVPILTHALCNIPELLVITGLLNLS